MKNLVIAGNHDQFTFWLRENSYNPKEYRYVSHEQDIRGIREAKIFRVGQYWLNELDSHPRVKMLENSPQ